MPRRYHHISFDLDGTLVHTVPEYRHAIAPTVVTALGGAITDRRAVDRFWFEGSRNEIIRREFGLDPSRFWAEFHAKDTPAGRSAHTRAYADAEPTLRDLKALGKIISIVTGAPHWIAAMEIEKLNGAPHDFYFSIAGSPFPEKPHPGSLLHTLERLNADPRETLYVGNSNEDAYFAQNTGVDFVYLERQEHPFDLRDYALATVHSLVELLSLPGVSEHT